MTLVPQLNDVLWRDAEDVYWMHDRPPDDAEAAQINFDHDCCCHPPDEQLHDTEHLRILSHDSTRALHPRFTGEPDGSTTQVRCASVQGEGYRSRRRPRHHRS